MEKYSESSKTNNLFENRTIDVDIIVPFIYSNESLNDYFLEYSKKYIEGKCRKEGYIMPGSVSVKEVSNGLLKGNDIYYKVTFSLSSCLPEKGQLFNARIKNITKIGIRAVVSEFNNPIILFVSSEHNQHKNMESYIVGQTILLKIIDFRFELYDDFISAIAEIVL
jgi:DNA-directed RNA polymerase subunit E'/Rpb7